MVRKQLSSFLKTIPVHFSSSASSESTEALVDVPPGVLNTLQEQVVKLPTPHPYKETIQAALSSALQDGQANPEFENTSLVVRGRPVEERG
ncbi:MAG: hypothetical protein AAF959_20085, partial [Cyanobacteria bacterium P01_D01_bin.56]